MTGRLAFLGRLSFQSFLIGATGLVYFFILLAGFFFLGFPSSLLQSRLETELAHFLGQTVNVASREKRFPFTLVWNDVFIGDMASQIDGSIRVEQVVVNVGLESFLHGQTYLQFTGQNLSATLTNLSSPLTFSRIQGHLLCQSTGCMLMQLTGQGSEGLLTAGGTVEFGEPRSESRLALEVTFTPSSSNSGREQVRRIFGGRGIQAGEASRFKLEGTISRPQFLLVSTTSHG